MYEYCKTSRHHFNIRPVKSRLYFTADVKGDCSSDAESKSQDDCELQFEKVRVSVGLGRHSFFFVSYVLILS